MSMSSTIGDSELDLTEFTYSRRIQPTFGNDEIVFSLDEWELVRNLTLTGISKIAYKFEYALKSVNDEREMVLISTLTGAKTERMDSLVLLYLRAKDLNVTKRFAITSQSVSPYENLLSGIFNVPIVKSVILKDGGKYLKIAAGGITQVDMVVYEPEKTKFRDVERESKRVQTDDKPISASKRRRDHTKIVHDILSLAQTYGDLGITRIIYKCNLNYKSALRAVSELLDNKLLEISNSSGAKQKYKITSKGLGVLEDLKKFNFIGS